MLHTSNVAICDRMDKWASIALREGWVELWVEGAIFPCEMVFYLAMCDQAGITNIFESGRQDGYSTQILGAYAAKVDGAAYSIDFERETERAQMCRDKLRKFPGVHLFRGDSIQLMGHVALRNRKGGAGVLIDGPKGYRAISLLLATSGFPWVRLLAIHNLSKDELPKERAVFQRLARGPCFYEDFPVKEGGSFARMKEAERAHCQMVRAERSQDYSSLGVINIHGRSRKRLLLKLSRNFGLRQPFILYTGWRLWERLSH